MINKQDLVLYMVAQLGTVRSQHQQTLIIPLYRVITGHITFSFFYHDALQCDRIIQKPCQFLLAPDEYLNHTIYPHYPSALICDDIIYLIKSYRLALFITYSDQTNCIYVITEEDIPILGCHNFLRQRKLKTRHRKFYKLRGKYTICHTNPKALRVGDQLE